ncbi:MAG: hypothetical protein KF842_04530 [Caulobacter sp.]|nr:hypothetical protein [Caulobacter sp.]
MRIRRTLLSLFAVAVAVVAPATALAAEPSAGHFIIDARLRYEAVTQDGVARDADALTLRTRLGYETPVWSGFKALVEAENVTAIVDDYNSTINLKGAYPVVADPEGTEINRAQISWTGESAAAVVGRQRIILGNARFVGNVGFRQNEQTFDAVRLDFRSSAATTFTYAYIDRVHRVFGPDSPQGEWDSDSHLLQFETKTPAGQLTGYAYLMAFESAPAQSNATLGGRLAGARPLGDGYFATYAVEYARQTDYRNSPAAFDLDYLALSGGIKKDPWWVAIDLERLDGDGVRGFRTPLATLHAFQGWADVFLNTPADGVRDIDLRAGLALKPAVLPRGVKIQAAVHDFSQADGGDRYGRELDLVVSAPLTDQLSAEIKGAWFDGAQPAYADRGKIWLTLEFRY